MSKNLQDQIAILSFVGSIKDTRLRADLFKYVSKNTYIFNALQEVAFNVMKDNIKIPENIKKRVRKHKSQLIKLIGKPNKRDRSKLVVQTGGSLSLIFPLVVSMLSALR